MNKHMLRAFGLSLFAALGLMAFAAVGAQAEDLTLEKTLEAKNAGLINILNGDPAGEPAVTGAQEGATGTLLIPALNSEIVCSGLTVANGKILTVDKGLGEVLYTGCVAWGTKVVIDEPKPGEKIELLVLTTQLPCEILEHSATLAAGAIVAKAFLLVVLHNGRTYVVATPDPAGGPFANVLTTTPSECPLPKLVGITGSVAFRVNLGDLNVGGEVLRLKLLLEANKTLGLNKLLGTRLLFGVNDAFIDGSAEVWLLSDCNWGLI